MQKTEKQRLELLVGPIASGKSTYCKRTSSPHRIIVNDDALVTALHGGNYLLYRKEFKPLYKTIENAILSVALSMGLSVVVDRPNYSTKMRRRYIGIAHSFDVPVLLVIFPWLSAEIHAKRRFIHDSRGYDLNYWLRVAEYHERSYQVPSEKEDFDDIKYYDYESNKLRPDEDHRIG